MEPKGKGIVDLLPALTETTHCAHWVLTEAKLQEYMQAKDSKYKSFSERVKNFEKKTSARKDSLGPPEFGEREEKTILTHYVDETLKVVRKVYC